MTTTDSEPDPGLTATDQPPASPTTGETDQRSLARLPEPEEGTNRADHDATEWLEETNACPEETTQETIEETAPETRKSWDRAEMAAVFTVVAVLAATSCWSAIALHGLAQQSGIPSWLAWGAPIIVDGPLFQSAIALVVLKRRARNGAPVAKGQRRFFWLTLWASELVSLVGNGAHAAKIPVTPLISAAIAGSAPFAAMAVLHGFTILLEVPRTAGPRTSAGNPEQARPANDFDTAQILTSEASPGDGLSSPAVSHPSPARLLETPEETTSVSYPSPGDVEETAERDEASPEERDAAIWALHLDGKSLREIADTTRLSKGYVGKIVARLRAEHDLADEIDEPDDGNAQVLHLVRREIKP